MEEGASISNPALVGITARPRLRYFSPWLVVCSLAWLVIYVCVFPSPGALAAKNWPLVLIGVAGAVIGNLTAIGGGLVFVPTMIFLYSANPVAALKLAFVTQAVGMTSGASGWLARGEVPVRLLKWTVVPLLLGSLVSSFVYRPNPMLVKGLFGPVTIIAGLLTLYTLDRKGGLPDLPPKANVWVAVMAFFGGIITGWVAIGEGEIVAAFCMLAYHLNANRALGLGVVLLSINSIFLALLHSLHFGGVPWNWAIFTMLGVLWGGRLGPFVAQWFSMRAAKKVFAVVAVLDGLLILLQALGVLARIKAGFGH
ncbi:MAG TPA: sulfite exporter TauE/SafE family protein [Chthoniobacteraceae bacterium]|nr:sulfite exporter TauE/SafE family protein [Chthoniobacteraceae bacterium]